MVELMDMLILMLLMGVPAFGLMFGDHGSITHEDACRKCYRTGVRRKKCARSGCRTD